MKKYKVLNKIMIEYNVVNNINPDTNVIFKHRDTHYLKEKFNDGDKIKFNQIVITKCGLVIDGGYTYFNIKALSPPKEDVLLTRCKKIVNTRFNKLKHKKYGIVHNWLFVTYT